MNKVSVDLPSGQPLLTYFSEIWKMEKSRNVHFLLLSGVGRLKKSLEISVPPSHGKMGKCRDFSISLPHGKIEVEKFPSFRHTEKWT